MLYFNEQLIMIFNFLFVLLKRYKIYFYTENWFFLIGQFLHPCGSHTLPRGWPNLPPFHLFIFLFYLFIIIPLLFISPVHIFLLPSNVLFLLSTSMTVSHLVYDGYKTVYLPYAKTVPTTITPKPFHMHFTSHK